MPRELKSARDRPTNQVMILIVCVQTLIRQLARSVPGLRDERGQTMAEYGILIGVVAIVVVAAAVFLGGSITSLFRDTGSHL